MTSEALPLDLGTASPALRKTLLELNNAHAVELSWADAGRMDMLVERAFLALGIGDPATDRLDAALIAFEQGADYDSVNFRWFADRLARFVYVDRVVTAAHARGCGHARHLYATLFAAAREAGYETVVCEVNSDPPNPASEAFHRSLGFEAIGEALLDNGKTVTYLAHTLAPDYCTATRNA